MPWLLASSETANNAGADRAWRRSRQRKTPTPYWDTAMQERWKRRGIGSRSKDVDHLVLLCLGAAAAAGVVEAILHDGLLRDAANPHAWWCPLSEDPSMARSPFRSRLPRPLGGCGDRTGAAHRHGCPVAYRTCAPIQSNCRLSVDRSNDLTRHAGVVQVSAGAPSHGVVSMSNLAPRGARHCN